MITKIILEAIVYTLLYSVFMLLLFKFQGAKRQLSFCQLGVTAKRKGCCTVSDTASLPVFIESVSLCEALNVAY